MCRLKRGSMVMSTNGQCLPASFIIFVSVDVNIVFHFVTLSQVKAVTVYILYI